MGTRPTRGPASPMPSHTAMLAAKLSKCVSCGSPAKGDFCQFCLEEE